MLTKLDRALRVVLRPMQIVSNFVFLTLTYFLGVGLSGIWYRLTEGRKKRPDSPESYWIPLPPKDDSRDRWLRPF